MNKEVIEKDWTLGDGMLNFGADSIDIKTAQRESSITEKKVVYAAEMTQPLDGLEAGTTVKGTPGEDGGVVFDFVFGLTGRLRFSYSPVSQKILGGVDGSDTSLSPEWISERVKITQKE